MANKGIPKFPLFDPFSLKMICPLFGIPTVYVIRTNQNVSFWHLIGVKDPSDDDGALRFYEKSTLRPLRGVQGCKFQKCDLSDKLNKKKSGNTHRCST